MVFVAFGPAPPDSLLSDSHSNNSSILSADGGKSCSGIKF